MTNYEIELDLSRSKGCIISEIPKTPKMPTDADAHPPVQDVAVITTTGATVRINYSKLYAPVVLFLLVTIPSFWKL